MNEPSFIKSDKYYYSVKENSIYGSEYDSFEYHHEVRHYKDYNNETYKNFSLKLSLYQEHILYFLGMLLFISGSLFFMGVRFDQNLLYEIASGFILILSPLAIFVFVEETRANLYAWKMKKYDKKYLSKVILCL